LAAQLNRNALSVALADAEGPFERNRSAKLAGQDVGRRIPFGVVVFEAFGADDSALINIPRLSITYTPGDAMPYAGLDGSIFVLKRPNARIAFDSGSESSV
jgi:hypothetical protein